MSNSKNMARVVLPDVRFGAFDVLLQQGNERFNLELLGFCHNVFDQTIYRDMLSCINYVRMS